MISVHAWGYFWCLFVLFGTIAWLWIVDDVYVCVHKEEWKTQRCCTEQMVPARHWTSDRGKINAHNFKTKKKLIIIWEHKIALQQCRNLINRCFVCGLLEFFFFFSSPFLQRWQFMLFKNGRQTFQIRTVCIFSSFHTRLPLPLSCLLLLLLGSFFSLIPILFTAYFCRTWQN